MWNVEIRNLGTCVVSFAFVMRMIEKSDCIAPIKKTESLTALFYALKLHFSIIMRCKRI